jgi:hypothetical protein
VYPVISSGTVEVNSLVLESGASLDIGTGSRLKVSASFEQVGSSMFCGDLLLLVPSDTAPKTVVAVELSGKEGNDKP